MTTVEYKDSVFWLESYRDGFIEFTRNDDDPKCFEIHGIFTALEAVEVHTFISSNYKYLSRHAQLLFDWLVDSPQQRVTHPQQGMGGANRFYFNSDLFTSFTAIRPECRVPWYPYVDDFPEPISCKALGRETAPPNFPLLLVFAPTAEAKSVGWIEAELLPEFSDFDLVITALEDYFKI